jgi:hypothetical protein
MIVKVAELVGQQANVAGATLAGRLRNGIVRNISESNILAPLVVFDFDGIESASASFLKALVFGLLPGAGSGRAEDGPSVEAFPVVVGLSPLIREELVDYVELAGAVAVEAEATDLKGDELLRARLVGKLDDALKSTLRALLKKGAATATELHAEAGVAISITAWNNRLSDLHSKRLARRRRNGKQWVYEPIARELENG